MGCPPPSRRQLLLFRKVQLGTAGCSAAQNLTAWDEYLPPDQPSCIVLGKLLDQVWQCVPLQQTVKQMIKYALPVPVAVVSFVAVQMSCMRLLLQQQITHSEPLHAAIAIWHHSLTSGPEQMTVCQLRLCKCACSA